MTEIVIRQMPDDATVPLDKLIAVAFAAALTVPAQVLLTAGVAATLTPVGKLSVRLTEVNGVACGFVISMVSVAICPGKIVAGEKDLLICGALTTVNVAEPAVVLAPASWLVTEPAAKVLV